MSAFQNALRAAPSSPMHWSNCALAARDLRLFQQALNLFDVALALDPDHHPAWNERSNVLYDMGRFTDALPGYDRALALCQTQAVYFHNRGECRLKLNDKVGAIATFRQALEVDPAYGFSRQRLHDLGEAQGQDQGSAAS
jgi:tetratricopeptide (TPR) repeat protein